MTGMKPKVYVPNILTLLSNVTYSGRFLDKNVSALTTRLSPAVKKAPLLQGRFCHRKDRQGRLNVRTSNIAIWARVTGYSGQKLPFPQPPEMPSTANCAIQSAAQ